MAPSPVRPAGQDIPKTDESATTVALDEGTAVALADRLDQRAEAGLPPIRLHDLRRDASAGGWGDMKVVQHMLRHASEPSTSTFYTSVLPEVA